ncbi:hypothetical protein RY27_02720 [Litorilinea aerophila]|nr:hypothetical protein RY27_02720 [Litorilinea aerophila]
MVQADPKILVINANPSSLSTIQAGIQTLYPRARVEPVLDGQAVLQAAADLRPDVAIIDDQPGGADLLASIRLLRDHSPRLPIVVLIRLEQEALADATLAAGADDYLLKTPLVYRRLPKVVAVNLERQTQRQQLASSQERYQQLFASVPVGLFRCGEGARMVAVNPALAEILGAPGPSQLLGHCLVDFFVDSALAAQWQDQLAQPGAEGRFEGEFRRLDGQTLWVRIQARKIADPVNGNHYCEGSLEDISKQRQAQQALRASEEKLRLIFEHAFDGISIYEELPESGSRRLLECNERYAEMAGRSKEELLALGNTSLLHRKVSRRFSRAENLIIRQHQLRYRGLFSWIRPDGKENVIEYSAAPINLDGRPLTIGIDRDITERIRAQEEIQRRAAHLEALNGVIAAGAMARAPRELMEQTARQLSRALQADRVLLWVGNEMVAEGIELEAAQAWQARLAPALSTGVQRIAGEVGEDEGSSRRDTLLAPITHEGRVLGGILARAVDVDAWPHDAETLAQAVGKEVGAALERLYLLDQVQTQARRLQMLMDASPDGLLFLDPEWRVVVANSAAEQALQRLGQMPSQTPLTHLGPIPLEVLLTASSPGEIQEIHQPEGTIYEVSARPVHTQQQEQGWLLQIRDVTRERERQQQSEQQGRLAAVGQLAAGIAHDFNNILAVILLLAQLLEAELSMPEKSRRRLENIIRQAQHASNLIHQILDFSRRSVLKRTTDDFSAVVAETAELLRRTLAGNIQVVDSYQAADFTMEADFTRLKQVLMNLAVNARDAMASGGTLTFTLERLCVQPNEQPPVAGLSAGEWIRLTVTDTGEGMSAEVLPHIFEPFFTTKEVGQGTGLGLSQVYGIVKQHGGEIAVESRPGQGARFDIYLPALPAPKMGETISEPTETVQGRSHTLLLVEDEELLREALAEVFQSYGYQVLTASGGAEALEKYEQVNGQVDLVISDMAMLGMNGIELHRALQQRAPAIRTIIISGHPSQRQQVDWRQLGIRAWLQKPVSVGELMEQVHKVLETVSPSGR